MKGFSTALEPKDEDKLSIQEAVVAEKDTVQSLHASEIDTPKTNRFVRRRLKGRHIQLIGIGGTIGTVLFVQLGGTLINGGAGSLFLAFCLWCIPVIGLTSCAAEMVTRFPLSSPFVRLAGRCVDDALEVAAGYTYLVLQLTLIPLEITAVTLIVHYWRTDFTPAATIVPQIGLYVLINVLVPVSFYGEVEFWLSLVKVILILGLIMFSFVTMVGGNPQHDAYGFRYFMQPAPFKEYVADGSLGRFLGFFSALCMAAYTVAGPDYVSMTAGEAINPRRTLPSAYKGAVIRLTVFFCLGTLALGVVCPSNDPNLIRAYAAGGTTDASGSPYVAGMIRMHIPVLPSIVNIAILTSAFSAGNSYFYCSTRTLYGMAVEGHAPRIFTWCTPNGVPYMAALVGVAFAMLSFLQMSNSATQVLNWIIGVGTSCELIIYAVITYTYIRFYGACKKQGIDRRTLPYRGWFQPYMAIMSFWCFFIMVWFAGYGVFLKGNWSVATFVTNYIMIPVSILIFIFWKLYKKTKFKSLDEIDLYSGLEDVEEHEKSVVYTPPRNTLDKVWRGLVGNS